MIYSKTMSTELIHDLLGYDGIKIIQRPDMFCFSLDSILLADFIQANAKTKKIIDLGTGNGPIPLFLTLKTKAHIYGIEIQPEVYDLAKRSVELNNLSHQITIINDDIKNVFNHFEPNTFDIVCSNPPYFRYLPTSNINKNDFLTIARHEVKITLSEVIEVASKLLHSGGSFFLVHRSERLQEIFLELKKNKLEAKSLRFIYQKTDSTESDMILIKATKGAKLGLKVMKPLYVYHQHEYTEEILKIFNFK